MCQLRGTALSEVGWGSQEAALLSDVVSRELRKLTSLPASRNNRIEFLALLEQVTWINIPTSLGVFLTWGQVGRDRLHKEGKPDSCIVNKTPSVY